MTLALFIFLLSCQASRADQPAFTDLGAITTNTGPDENAHVVTDGRGNWIAVWAAKPSGADYDIWLSTSTNNGATWRAPRTLNTNAASDSGNDQYPRLATDGQGNWVAVWQSTDPRGTANLGTDLDILVSRSANNGTTWSAPAALNSSYASKDGVFSADESPDIAYGEGVWMVVWSSRYDIGGIGVDDDILWSKSENKGSTWSAPAAMKNAASDLNASMMGFFGARDLHPHVVYRGRYSTSSSIPGTYGILVSGAFITTWEANANDGNYLDYDIFIASAHFSSSWIAVGSLGAWTQPVALYTHDSIPASDNRGAIVACSGANCVAVWQSAVGKDTDILVARSSNGGGTWTSPAVINSYMSSDTTTVDTEPDITTDGDGHWVAVWASNRSITGCGNTGLPLGGDYEIFRATSTNNGAAWNCFETVNGAMVFLYPSGGEKDDDRCPSLATDGKGNWVVAWQSRQGSDDEINMANVVPPAAKSITPADPNPTDARSVRFTVSFSESVSGVDKADFKLVTSGSITGATIDSVEGSGSSRTVKATFAGGTGTLNLQVQDNDSILDSSGNSLGGWGAGNGAFTTGLAYTIGVAPTVTSIRRLDPSPILAPSVRFEVVFSEPVTGMDIGDFTSNHQPGDLKCVVEGVQGHYISKVSGSNNTYVVTVNTGSGTGSLNLSVVDDNTIKDVDTPGGGIPLGGWGRTDIVQAAAAYFIDKTPPTTGTVLSPAYSIDNTQLTFNWLGFTEEPSSQITGYLIAFGPEGSPEAYLRFTNKGPDTTITFKTSDFPASFPSARVTAFPNGKYRCTVKAVNTVGLISGAAFATVTVDTTAYVVGQEIPPEGANIDWANTKVTPETHGKKIVRSNKKCLLVTDWGKPITVTWTFTNGSSVERPYNTAPGAVKTPVAIYSTHAGTSGASTGAPQVDLANVLPYVKIHYNETVPDATHLWIDQNRLCATKTVGTPEPAFIVLEYYDNKGAFLDIEVVQVKPCVPDVRDGDVHIGSRLLPYSAVSDAEAAPPYIMSGRGTYIYEHTVDYSPQKGQLWAVQKNDKGTTANMEVIWRRKGVKAVEWPYELRRYSAAWPDHDPAKYQRYVRGDSAAALGARVALPASLKVDLMTYRDFDDPRHDAHLDPNGFYTDGPGWALLQYQTGSPTGREWVGFEVVRSVRHNDTAFFDLSAVHSDIGTEITHPYHEGPAPGHIYVPEGDRYAPEIYQETGQIFAVNVGPLEVWWYNLSRVYDPGRPAERVQWPSKVVRYRAGWPAGPKGILIARTNGSGVIDPATYGSDWGIYWQNDSGKPGFNPNDEHALSKPYSIGAAVFALRDDLGTPATSEPYVLMNYKEQPGNRLWRFEVYQVVRSENPYVLSDWTHLSTDPNHDPASDPYEMKAGVLIQAPFPLNLLDYKGEAVPSGQPSEDHFWKDRDGYYWAMSAGNDGGAARITMRYYYKPQESFFFPPGRDLRKTSQDLVPWLDDGTGVPVNVIYTVSWPDAPPMRIGQTVIQTADGLTGTAGYDSAEIIYQQSVQTSGKPSVMLIDPVRTRVVDLSALPKDIRSEQDGTERVFPDLSLALRLRVSYDPLQQKLKFKGIQIDPTTGFDYALVNVMSEIEHQELLALGASVKNPQEREAWKTAVDSLYALASKPVEVAASSMVFDGLAYTSGFAQGVGYVTMVFNNNPKLTSPVEVKILRVVEELDPGAIMVIYPFCPFDETLTLRHTGDFGGRPELYEFQWKSLPDQDGTAPVERKDDITDEAYWQAWRNADHESGMGVIDTTIKGPGLKTLSDNWFICRYRRVGGNLPWSGKWSKPTEAMLAEGWIKRVMAGVGPFKQRADGSFGGIQGAETRFDSYKTATVNTVVSMISQAGEPWNGDVPMSCKSLDDFGLIQIYQTVLGRGCMLSIDSGFSYPPADQALLLVASRISDLYTLLGNEAYADAADPTIAFGTEGQYGAEASSIHCFMNVADSLIEEELALLRGRDDSKAPGVKVHPFYNRLLWNFTRDITGGEVAYALNYNVQDGQGRTDGVINEADAKRLYPQGHGDAWGQYLTAIKTYYRLLRHPVYDWQARSEAVLVGGAPVTVDYLDERKFAQAAAAKARTATEIVNLTYREAYLEDPAGQWQGYKDTDPERAWGFSEWASRTGVGVYLDWVVGNAILPPEDTNPGHTGIQKIDRTTVLELRDVASRAQEIQAQLDTADAGLSPLGLATNVVPFDINPSEIDAGKTHFEQIYDRAVMAMNNAITVFNHANNSTQLLRRQADTLTDFERTTEDRRIDFRNRLIEVFGYPYADDIGPGKTYPTGYEGPDLYNYAVVDPYELVGVYPSVTQVPLMVKSFEVGPDGSLKETQKSIVFHLCTSADRFGLVKNPTWTGQRRAPGEIQMAQSDLIQARTRFERALTDYDNLVAQIQDQADLLEAQHDLNAEEINILNIQFGEQERLNGLIKQSRTRQMNFRTRARMATLVANAVAEALPTSVGFSVDATSVARSAIRMAGTVTTESYTQDADRESLAEMDHQNALQAMQAQNTIVLTTKRQEVAILQQVKQLEQLVRQEVSLRLELYTMQEAMQQASGRYMRALAQGDRLLEDLGRFNYQTAAQVQAYRYKDMAFRIFRNDALQKYRAQFDLAARYVYLAAKAYDYETTFLSGDSRAGQAFLSDIVRERLIGTIVDELPQTGMGLADRMARMSQNFNVLKGRLGFTNPQRETNRFSLRSELFRIRPDAAGSVVWRETLWCHVAPNLLEVPEFQRYARVFQPHSAVEPGLIIPFATNINFGLNFFGWPLGGGDSAYDSTNFTTKVRSVGVWFSNYRSVTLGGMSNTPRVYLIPVGDDIQRSPTNLGGEIREFKVLDQVLPVPFAIGKGDLRNQNWIPGVDTLTDTFAAVRRYPSFRAYHDGGQFSEAETHRDSRLIGRSVWNTQWLLIIPAGSFLADREEGLRRFIDGGLLSDGKRDGNGVSDIKIFFETYAYPGD